MLPTNLEECFKVLKDFLSADDLAFIKKNHKNVSALHHTLGRKIRNEWGLWSGSELKQYFEKLNLPHPDDMSGVILHSFHLHLNGLPLEVEKQIKKYQEYWEAVNSGVTNFFIGEDGSITPIKE
jgi:hypothetical protein